MPQLHPLNGRYRHAVRRIRNDSDPGDHWRLLGLARGSSAASINEAKRRLAKHAHPDVGGTVEQMQRLNRAAAAALGEVAPASPSHSASRPGQNLHGGDRRDHPSFTIEALPVESFEALLIVASWLGEVITDDPPYLLEVALVDPVRGWCRLDLVPDAGSCTVSLAVAAEPGYPVPSLDAVRDLWIEGLNQLDWSNLTPQ